MARVIEVRTQEKSRAEQALADARRSLHIAQKEVELRKVEADAAAAEAAVLQQEAKQEAAELRAATMRADQERLVADLEDNQQRQRLANFAVATTADALTEAEQREADMAARVDAATA